MPKRSWNLNTVYISERLQECLRPISRCALTTVVAPMGYGKTTAVNWYLLERAKLDEAAVVRISVYSDNLAIFWKSVQEAFSHAGLDFLRAYPCPDDAAGGSLLTDDLCHALGQAALLYFHRRLSPLDRQPRARLSLHADEPPARKRSPDRRKPRPLPARGGDPAPWRQALHRGCRAAAPQPHGALDLRPPLRHGALGRADRIAALFERGVVLGHLLKSPHAARARRAAEPQLGYLRDVLRRNDRPAAVKAARIFGRHGSCGRIHRRDG